MDSIKIKLEEGVVKKILEEIPKPIIGLYPGAFKPSTKAHFEVVSRASKICDEVHIIISNTIREGYSPEVSLKVWKQYKKLLPKNVHIFISTKPTPITEVYSVIKNKNNNYLVMYGKGEEGRYNHILENQEKYNNVEIVDVGNYHNISSTILREAISKRNLAKIQSLIPEGIKVNDFLMNFQIHEEKIPGGLAQGKNINDIAKKHNISSSELIISLNKGIKVEMEHTNSKEIAKEIAMDHLWEDEKYYDKLSTIEEDLDESKNLGTLYHFTKLQNIETILNSNTLKPSTSTAEEFERDFQFYSPEERKAMKDNGVKTVSFISLTRDKNLYKKNPKISGSTVRISLDGTKLSSKYKIKPFSYYADEIDSEDTRSTDNEGEERVYMKSHEYLTSLKSYIIGVDIILDKIEDNEDYLKLIEDIKHKIPNINIIYKDKPYSVEQYRNEILPTIEPYRDEEIFESKLLKEVFQRPHAIILNKAIDYVCNDLGINKPKITLISKESHARDNGSFAGYSPSTKDISVVTFNRNLADIMRSVAHELFHLKQDIDGRLNQNSGKDGDIFENEANSYAGKIMREIGRNIPEIFE